MISWLSYALWVRAVVKTERALPAWLRDCIEQRCPGFLDSRSERSDLNALWLDLSTWVDQQQFRAAGEGGWLEALHYYSGRDPRTERIWDHWTRTETEWGARTPEAYPPFDSWHREALSDRDAAENEDAGQVEDYVEWEAVAFWARLIAEPAPQLPNRLVTVLEQRCAGFVNQSFAKSNEQAELSTRLWKDLLAWIEDHRFAEAKDQGRLEALRAAARSHLRGERITAYWEHCSSKWGAAPPKPYPDFEEWLRDADEFVTK
ncbi:MAG: hypothetical protein R2729_06115 [Bryobacteraceae bacterium]